MHQRGHEAFGQGTTTPTAPSQEGFTLRVCDEAGLAKLVMIDWT